MSAPITALDQLPLAFAQRFNAGDIDELLALFTPDAVFVPQPGTPVSGDDIKAALEQFLAIGLPFVLTPVQHFSSGDTGLVIADWSIEGTAPDGTDIQLGGRTADVARHDETNGWRYAIDNPFGTV